MNAQMTDDEFNKAMTALMDIWRVCPKDLPKDLSTKHDHYYVVLPKNELEAAIKSWNTRA